MPNKLSGFARADYGVEKEAHTKSHHRIALKNLRALGVLLLIRKKKNPAKMTGLINNLGNAFAGIALGFRL